MARDEAPPFARGETYYNGSTKDPIFSDPLNYAGKEYVFEPNSPDGQNTGDPAGRPIRVKVVQNVSGIALLPSRIARFKVQDPLETAVDGYWYAATDIVGGVIDEFLPAAGVANGDFFYLVVDGPTTINSIVGSFAAIAAGARLEVSTGTSATNADAGRVTNYASSPTVTDEVALVGRAQAALGAAGLVKAVVHISHK